MTEKKACCETHKHPEHTKELPNINRIIGQLEGIKKMIDGNRYCTDILIQLMATRSAIRSVSGNILRSHLQSCVTQSFGSKKEQQQRIDEIKSLFDKFE
jgi:CsoR family transcriptional regulator, copper-sensing transcriptional repressor